MGQTYVRHGHAHATVAAPSSGSAFSLETFASEQTKPREEDAHGSPRLMPGVHQDRMQPECHLTMTTDDRYSHGPNVRAPRARPCDGCRALERVRFLTRNVCQRADKTTRGGCPWQSPTHARRPPGPDAAGVPPDHDHRRSLLAWAKRTCATGTPMRRLPRPRAGPLSH